MRWFETRGPVYPEDNYVVARRGACRFYQANRKRQVHCPLRAAPDRQNFLLPKRTHHT